MANRATQTLLVKPPLGSLDTVAACGWGGWCVARVTAHTTHTQKEREREREEERETGVPFSPASAPTISPARTRRCSWARRGTSWYLPFYLGAPTRFCGEVGVRKGWGVEWRRANPYQVVSMATSIG